MGIAALFKVACGDCGHQAPIDNFTERPITGRLPNDRYQCPACGRAWRLALETKGTTGTIARRPTVAIIPTDPLM